MEIDYRKDSKEGIPFEHYLEEFARLDPAEASGRTGIPYNPNTREFSVRMMQKEFLVSWPDCGVKKADPRGYGVRSRGGYHCGEDYDYPSAYQRSTGHVYRKVF